jgi:hypothetical protein
MRSRARWLPRKVGEYFSPFSRLALPRNGSQRDRIELRRVAARSRSSEFSAAVAAAVMLFAGVPDHRRAESEVAIQRHLRVDLVVATFTDGIGGTHAAGPPFWTDA